MLKLPQDKVFTKKIVNELFRIEQTSPEIMKWLRLENDKLHKVNSMMMDEIAIRWNQGALQLLDALFTHIREVRTTQERIDKGD